MTGKEALKYLQAGYTLRRKEWDPDQKCKAYLSDDLWSIRFEIGGSQLEIAPQYVPEKPEYDNYVCYYDVIDSGDLLEDDWEIVE